jgi:intracellular multiplication protein IcmT
MRFQSPIHWRDSARPVRFFIWDGRAVFPFLLVMLYPRWSTLIIATIATLFFTLIGRFGFTPIVFLRSMRSWISGSHIQANPWWSE